MSIVFYLIAIMAVVYGMISLGGRNVATRWKGEYSFLEKIDPSDPARKSMMITGFVTHSIAAVVSLGFGLYRDGLLQLTQSDQLLLSGCFAAVLMGGGTYTVVRAVRSGRSNKRTAARNQAKPSVWVGNIEVVQGKTTPRAFEGGDYLVAYDTFVQAPGVPFSTCELRAREDGRYIGDLLFESNERLLSEKEFWNTPILQVHLDRGFAGRAE